MFAGRLLIPEDMLRHELPAATWRGWPVIYRLADTFVVSPTAMFVRLQELHWAHRGEDNVPRSGRAHVPGQAELPFA